MARMNVVRMGTVVALTVVVFAVPARADEASTVAAAAPDDVPKAVPAPPQYAAPWGLPSVFSGTGVRLDNSFALSKDMQSQGVFTDASVLGMSYKIRPGFAVAAKVGWVVNQPATGDSQTTVSNPAIGANFTVPFGNGIFLGAALSTTIPVGMGGGNTPNRPALVADRAGIFARSALDQALFSTNYLTIVPMVSAAWLGHGTTVQGTAALTQAIRTRGELVSTDAYQTGMGMGLHVGYFPIRPLSIGTELRYVVALTATPQVKMDPAMREQVSVAVGIRGHLAVGPSSIHPGLSYTRGIDAPMARASYNVIGVDLPVVF